MLYFAVSVDINNSKMAKTALLGILHLYYSCLLRSGEVRRETTLQSGGRFHFRFPLKRLHITKALQAKNECGCCCWRL